jgi:hypothetical protein
MSRLFAVIAAALVLQACAPNSQARMKELRAQETELTRSMSGSQRYLEGAQAYVAELSGAQPSAGVSVYFTAPMLEQLAAQALPYELPGREFHGKLQGQIRIEKLTGFRFLSGNRLRCRALLRGINVRYAGSVPSFAKKQADDFVSAFNSGGAWADLEVELSLDGTRLVTRGQALSTQLVTRRDSMAEGMMRDEMNNRAFRKLLAFDVTDPSGAKPRRVLVTGNHVVLTYAP